MHLGVVEQKSRRAEAEEQKQKQKQKSRRADEKTHVSQEPATPDAKTTKGTKEEDVLYCLLFRREKDEEREKFEMSRAQESLM